MEYLRLSDCSYFSSKRTSKIDYETYISTENMIQNKGGISIAETLPLIKSTSKYEEGDILLSNIRPYFKKIWLANREGGCSNDVLVIKSKDGFDNKFLYYVLSNDNFFNYDTITSKGTKMPRGTPNAIMKYLVPKISLIKQQKIADILSAYDELIENNNRQIEILEAEAEELYKEWFVRFRFPSHESVPFEKTVLGKIPNTFSVVNMEKIFDYYIGGGWGNDNENKDYCEQAYVIRGTDFPNVIKGDLTTCPNRFHKASNYRTRKLQPDDIIIEVSGGTAEQPVGRAIIVSKDVLDRLNNKVICASFCKLIRLKKEFISPIYFYHWMKFLYNTRVIDKFQLQSTGIINFKFDYFLRKGLVMIPSHNVMIEFEKKVNSIRKKIDKLAYQNELLKQQRDLLLPRLMSGKLEVNTKENVVVNDKFNDIREYWQKVKYDENNFGIAARSNGKISEETLQKLKDIAEEDD